MEEKIVTLAGGYEFRQKIYQTSGCAEFTVARKFSVVKWFLWSSFFYVIFSAIGLHQQNNSVLIFLVSLATVVLLYKLYSRVIKESLLIIASVGVQISTTYICGRQSALFLPFSRLRDLHLLDHITPLTITSYLALEVANQTPLSPVFSQQRPLPLAQLTTVYRTFHALFSLERTETKPLGHGDGFPIIKT